MLLEAPLDLHGALISPTPRAPFLEGQLLSVRDISWEYKTSKVLKTVLSKAAGSLGPRGVTEATLRWTSDRERSWELCSAAC